MPSLQLSVMLLGVVAAAAYWILHRYLAVKQDPREPLLIPSRVPLIGHLFGLVWHKSKYYIALRQKYSHPIYTLPILTSKLYVVNSVDLISSVQRYPRALSFEPIEAKFAGTVCGSSKEADDIVHSNINYEDGGSNYWHDANQSMHSALAPGAGLDGLNRVMIQNVAGSLERLRPIDGQLTRIGLAKSSRREITLATTNAVYGEHNPFKDSTVEQAFW